MYTAGALEFFLDHELYFPYVIGVSAGAGTAASYLSKQKGRNYKVNIDYAVDPRYLSFRNFLRNREIFGMDFIFGEIPKKLVPYDYQTFYRNPAEFVIGTTDCITGEPVYFKKQDYQQDMLTVLKASSSLPFVSKEISYKNRWLLDGGISDPIPIRKAQEDGFKKNIVILTRNKGYTKQPTKLQFLVRKKYPNYIGLQAALKNRYKIYNETIAFLDEEEQKGSTVIIRPSEPLEVGRIERNPDKLENLYKSGYKDAEQAMEKIANLRV